jgi:hypothetical protein
VSVKTGGESGPPALADGGGRLRLAMLTKAPMALQGLPLANNAAGLGVLSTSRA